MIQVNKSLQRTEILQGNLGQYTIQVQSVYLGQRLPFRARLFFGRLAWNGCKGDWVNIFNTLQTIGRTTQVKVRATGACRPTSTLRWA